MVKINQKADFINHTIYVGIDVHLKSWNVSLYCNQQYLKSFNQPPLPEALQSFLINSYPGAFYKCAYESGFCGYWIQRELLQKNIDCIVVMQQMCLKQIKAQKTKLIKMIPNV